MYKPGVTSIPCVSSLWTYVVTIFFKLEHSVKLNPVKVSGRYNIRKLLPFANVRPAILEPIALKSSNLSQLVNA